MACNFLDLLIANMNGFFYFTRVGNISVFQILFHNVMFIFWQLPLLFAGGFLSVWRVFITVAHFSQHMTT